MRKIITNDSDTTVYVDNAFLSKGILVYRSGLFYGIISMRDGGITAISYEGGFWTNPKKTLKELIEYMEKDGFEFYQL